MAKTRSETAKSGTTAEPKTPAKKSILKPSSKPTKASVLVSTSITIVVLAVLAVLVHNDTIRLNGSISSESLTSLGQRIEFTFRFLSIGVVWLIFCVLSISLKRLNSKAIDPVAGYDDLIENDVRILQNSVEQWIISASTQLALVSHLSGPEAARIIPFLNFSFIIGRLLFWLGYPNRRSYGFIITFLPSVLAASYAVWKLIQTVYVP